jgi:L-lysine 2,3-aminomutase
VDTAWDGRRSTRSSYAHQMTTPPEDMPLLADVIPTRQELAELTGVDVDEIADDDDD